MKIYKNCRELNIFRFYEILDTKDYKYLIKDYEDVEIGTKLQHELTIIWNDIFKEYIVLKDDKEIRTSFKKLAHISKLETKLSMCVALVDSMVVQTTNEAIKEYVIELKSWGYIININKPIQPQVEAIVKRFKSLKSNINIKRSEYEKEHKKELSTEKINIDKQVVNIEQTLGNVINSNTTSVSKWVYYVKRAEEISKQHNKK